MGVSRGMVQRLLAAARCKVVPAIVVQQALEISQVLGSAQEKK